MKKIVIFCCCLLLQIHLHAQESVITVQGKVVDSEMGDPIPGASIVEKGTSRGTVTDFDGFFEIKVPGKANLEISYLGYATQVVSVNGRTQLTIQLEPQAEELGEVVLVGYGTQKKENLTGSVSTIAVEQLESRPVNNVMQALQGAAPGLLLTVGNSGGEPGANMNISIRGVGNLQGTGAPLVIVDDIPLDNPSELNDINPNDIESVSVLKDAASSAIYGSRAAFGVILVKSKSGELMDGNRVTYSNNFIYSSPLNTPNMMNSLEFANYFNLAASNAGSSAVFTDDVIERIKAYMADPINTPVTVPNADGTTWNQYGGSNGNTNWFKEMYKGIVFRQQHNLSFSGKQKGISYNVSGSILDAPGILNYGDDSYMRYTFNSRVSSKINDWLTFSANLRMARSENDRPSYDRGLYLHNIARRWPTNGVIMPNGSYSDGSEIPFLVDGGRYKEIDDALNGSVNFVIEPIKDLKIKPSLLYRTDNFKYSNHVAKVSITEPNGTERFIQSTNSFSRYHAQSTYISPNLVISYDKSFNDAHNFGGLIGYQQENTNYAGLNGSINDLITDGVPSISTGVGEDNVGDNAGSYATQGYFGRFTYNYKEKYLFEVNGRYDASSRFSSDSRWDFFPSISAGYNIAKEDFWNIDKISMFKLRYSTGSIGNQNVPNYLYIGRMPIQTNLWWLGSNGRPNYTLIPGIISPNITWESVATDNYALDVTAFDSRLQMTFEIFKRTTKNMFGPSERLPGVLGTNAPQANNANLETTGFDFNASWRDLIGQVGYNVGVVLSDAVSKVTAYSNPNNLLNTYRPGQKLGEIWGFETIGLYQDQAQIDNGADQTPIYGGVWYPGDVQYKDLNNDGRIDYGDSTSDNPGDRKVIGNSTPRYTFGLNMGLDYRGFDFSMLWQGVAKRDVWAGGAYTFGASGGLWQSAGMKEHLNYWSEDNPGGFFPRPTFRSSERNQEVQSRYLQNASYARLKNLSLGYNFQPDILHHLGLKKFRVFVTGENLITISDISGIFDPEATGGYWGNGKIYPLQKSYSMGINVQF